MRVIIFILALGLGLLFTNCSKDDDANESIECQELDYFIGCWEGDQKISIFQAGLDSIAGQFGEDLEGSLFDFSLNLLTCEISGKWELNNTDSGTFKMNWDGEKLSVDWRIPAENRTENYTVEKTSENPCI